MSTSNSGPVPLRIAVAQFAATTGDMAGNAAIIARLIDCAGSQGAHVVLFPELALSGYDLPALLKNPGGLAIDVQAPVLDLLKERCRANGMVAVIGAPLRRGDRVGNSVIVLDGKGTVAASYDKRYLDGMEQQFFQRGAEGRLLEINGWTLALGICYDASFPEMARAAAHAGADVLLYAGAFVNGASDQRRALYHPARALDNTCYVAFSNFAGHHAGMEFCGASAMYGPDGQVLAMASATEEAVFVNECVREVLDAQREAVRMLQDCLTPVPQFERIHLG